MKCTSTAFLFPKFALLCCFSLTLILKRMVDCCLIPLTQIMVLKISRQKFQIEKMYSVKKCTDKFFKTKKVCSHFAPDVYFELHRCISSMYCANNKQQKKLQQKQFLKHNSRKFCTTFLSGYQQSALQLT